MVSALGNYVKGNSGKSLGEKVAVPRRKPGPKSRTLRARGSWAPAFAGEQKLLFPERFAVLIGRGCN